MRPAVHHNPKKQACVRFRHRGEYKKIYLASPDRAAALKTVRALYRGATQVSVVFFVKAEEAE